LVGFISYHFRGFFFLRFGQIETVTTTARLKRKTARLRPGKKVAAGELFWIRPASSELDRTGKFLLENLGEIRNQAASRASAP
jgi:hypothetical protein